MMDDEIARLRTHQKNIDRYQDLLKTKLTEMEVQYFERRLSEERIAMEMLRLMNPSDQSKEFFPDRPTPSQQNRLRDV